MSDERDDERRKARDELEAARERYERAREQEREARRSERSRSREDRRTLRDEIRRGVRASLPEEFGDHVGRTIRESMNFNFDLGELTDLAGEEYSETIEKDFAVGEFPRLHVRNVSGDTKVVVGPNGTVHVRARKRVRGTSEERAKRLLENVEVRMVQEGDEIFLKPHLYEQDRGWADLFRGGRVAVDFDIAVPREIRLESHTVSGDVTLSGTRGPLEVQSTSGDVRMEDAQGPTRLKTVSGDAAFSDFAGQLEANSVSGDLSFDGCAFHGSDITTVSGDVRFDGELSSAREHRMKTISGDVSLALVGDSYEIRFKSMSGDLETAAHARVESEDRHDKRVTIGAGGTRVTVKTVSGDLEVKAGSGSVPERAPEASADVPEDVERTQRMEPPAAEPRADVRAVLERLARGELDVDAAAAALDEARGGR